MVTITTDSFADWRRQTRELLRRKIRPEMVVWQASSQASLDFGDNDDRTMDAPVICDQPMLPSEFFDLAADVSCFRDPRRWALLYRLAWRLLYENRDLLALRVDVDVAKLRDMQKAVARDKHKMKAFVRFRRVTDDKQMENEHYLAWFEPTHLIVESLSPFFAKRFANMYWSILTPDRCAHWDRQQLSFTEGCIRKQLDHDDIEDLWCEYYQHTFNPARLKLNAMQSEMPKKYWVNLPEAPFIAQLSRNSRARVDKMTETGGTSEWKKTQKSRFVKAKQRSLQQRNQKNNALEAIQYPCEKTHQKE